jgi:hypothetical protein
LAVFVVAACVAIHGQSSPKQMADPAVAALGSGFVSDTAQVNGATLHYVRGGAGPAIILLHGFPEDWYAYHRIMPQLAKQFTVVAVDLRGIGGSAATAGGYDAANMAEDVHQTDKLVERLSWTIQPASLNSLSMFSRARSSGVIGIRRANYIGCRKQRKANYRTSSQSGQTGKFCPIFRNLRVMPFGIASTHSRWTIVSSGYRGSVMAFQEFLSRIRFILAFCR